LSSRAARAWVAVQAAPIPVVAFMLAMVPSSRRFAVFIDHDVFECSVWCFIFCVIIVIVFFVDFLT
jgi:hypothetical protein